MGVVATMAGGEARSGRRGGGSSALEEVKRRGENELGFIGWLSGDEKVRRGDAWWCRRRTARAEKEMELMAVS